LAALTGTDSPHDDIIINNKTLGRNIDCKRSLIETQSQYKAQTGYFWTRDLKLIPKIRFERVTLFLLQYQHATDIAFFIFLVFFYVFPNDLDWTWRILHAPGNNKIAAQHRLHRYIRMCVRRPQRCSVCARLRTIVLLQATCSGIVRR